MDRAPFVFFDLEMTGLDTARDRVVEISAVRVRGSVEEGRLTTLVCPEDLHAHAQSAGQPIHGIPVEALLQAPPFASVATQIGELFDGAIPVAHAAPWDIAFLEAEFTRTSTPKTFPLFLDTLVLARRAFAFRRYALSSLVKELGIVGPVTHRAEDDVVALRGVWDRCVAALAPTTPRDLWEVRVGERRARTAILIAAEEACEGGVPVLLTYRPVRKPPESALFVVQEVRGDLDPPRVLGYQLPDRGRREIRADRILRIEPGPPGVRP
jgi:DNA polymerase-3 subunit epsilon